MSSGASQNGVGTHATVSSVSERRAEHLAMLADVSERLLGATDPNAMVRELYERLKGPLQLSAFFNFMVNDEGDALRLDVCSGISEKDARSLYHLEFGQAVCGTVAATRKPMKVWNIQESCEPLVQLVKGYGIRAYACHPLFAGERLLGTLSFASRERNRFEDDEVELLRTVTHHVAMAKERLRYAAELAAHNARLQRAVEAKTQELEATNRALRASERLASLGTFSAGVGHELANMLLPVRAALGSALDASDVPPDLKHALRGASRCTEYLAELSSALRLLCGSETSDEGPAATDLAVWAERAEPLLRLRMPAAVELKLNIPPSLPCVAFSEAALTHSVINLVQNAREAILAARGEKGCGLIEVWAREDLVTGTMRIAVRDDGPGMSEDVRTRCLEPFFTTKPSTLGTGLGLSVVHASIKRAGGRLDIETTPGMGSEFTMVLPMAAVERPGPCTAQVTLSDVRLGGLVRDMLGSLTGTPAEIWSENAMVWVTDDRSATPDQVRAFITTRAGRRVLALTSQTSWTSSGATLISPKATWKELRAALRELVGASTASMV